VNTSSFGNQHEGEESSLLFAKLADTFREQGELDRAIEALTQGLAEKPDYITARIVLAACLKEKGDLDGAYNEFEYVLKLDPFHTAAMKKLGLLLLDMDRPEEAIVHLKRYLEELPGDGDVKELLERLEGSPIEEKSSETTEIEEVVLPDTSVEEEGEGKAEIDIPGAKEAGFEDVGVENMSLIPTEEDELIATMTLAEIYASQGFYDKAIEIYQKILNKEPTNEIAKKRIDAIRRGDGVDGGAYGGYVEKVKEVDYSGGGTPGEVVADEEYESFRKWLVDLTRRTKTKIKNNRW